MRPSFPHPHLPLAHHYHSLRVTVRRTALLDLSCDTVTKVSLLDMDQLVSQPLSDFGRMQITRSVVRFVRPYSDGVGL
jgi:hypothetical protein